jgi:hypothetical protein
VALALLLALFVSMTAASAQPWKFGVMPDTQWTCSTDPAGTNPHTVPGSIISQIRAQFINAGVKLVIEIGDLTDDGQDVSEQTRAAAAQPLYDAGIGFFPFRGNHETYGTSNSFGIPVFQSNYPQTQGLGKTWGATNFSSPTSVSIDLKGMSYSFDYENARFVIIDPWVTPSKDVNPGDGYDYGYSIGDQQAWISSRLNRFTRGGGHGPGDRQPWIISRLGRNTRGPAHAFVFSHQPLMAESHQDSPFTGYTNANPDMQNAFFASLQNNGVRYYISGHDHMHQRSIIASPDGLSQVHEIISGSDSSKFYTPKALTDPNWFGQKVRETSLAQDLYRIGFYIYTVDGPRVTVDYYADDHGDWLSDASYPTGPAGAGTHVTPVLNFVKRETFGYSLNGQEFLVPQGGSYTTVQDSFDDTIAQILSGTNGSTAMDYTLRPLTKTVDTGWTPETDAKAGETASDVLSLWGMTDVGSDHTDPYALSLSYDQRRAGGRHLSDGTFGIATLDAGGNWINAVDANSGGVKQFVVGPWDPSYGFGTYGVDPKKKVAWAVINHDGQFAVTGGL